VFVHCRDGCEAPGSRETARAPGFLAKECCLIPESARDFIDCWIENCVHASEADSAVGAEQDVSILTVGVSRRRRLSGFQRLPWSRKSEIFRHTLAPSSWWSIAWRELGVFSRPSKKGRPSVASRGNRSRLVAEAGVRATENAIAIPRHNQRIEVADLGNDRIMASR